VTGVRGAHLPQHRVRATTLSLVAGLALLTALELTELLAHIDGAVMDVLVAHRTARMTAIATAVTDTGASPFTYPLVAVAGLVTALRTRRWRPGVVALAVLGLGVFSRLLLSVLVGDARPALELQLVAVSGFSFPSGHAAASALLAGTLIWLAGRAGLPRRPRLVVGAVLLGWAVLVGVSRIYLGVHWVSDVVGSWLLAAAWLSALPLLDPVRRVAAVGRDAFSATPR
jgi:membrane-associated phospholipid phosphatase